MSDVECPKCDSVIKRVNVSAVYTEQDNIRVVALSCTKCSVLLSTWVDPSSIPPVLKGEEHEQMGDVANRERE